jgi:uncharacterized membrane protein
MRKVVLPLTLIFLAGFAASAGFSEEMDLYVNSEKSFSGYTFAYTGANSGSYFEVKKEVNGKDTIVEQVPQEDLFDMEKPHTFNVSEDLQVELEGMDSDSDGVYMDLNLYSPRNIFADVDMSSSAPSKVFVAQGEEVTVPLTLENTGIVNQTFGLNASHNSSMDVSFNFQNFNVTELKIEAGEEESINAKFNVPETAETGTYNVEMAASNEKVARESITVEIRQSQESSNRREIDLSSEQSYIGLKPGEQKETSVRVRNQGNVMLDNIELSTEAPENWDVQVEREQVPSLEEYESFRSIITIEAPANAEPGDQFLEVSASSDDVSTEEPERIRMTIQQQSNLRYIGLGIMGLSLAGLVLVYRKLGRR